jgi:hypothetical protein
MAEGESNVFELLGVLLKPRQEIPPIKGIHTYLDFVVLDESHRPAAVYTAPRPQRYAKDCPVIPQLQRDSSTLAMRLTKTPLYREVPPDIAIDLDTQVICQDLEGIYLANARSLNNYRITLRDLIRKQIRRNL